ncbi:hypothetical protein Unana1_08316 [Umbelopsis nana]
MGLIRDTIRNAVDFGVGLTAESAAALKARGHNQHENVQSNMRPPAMHSQTSQLPPPYRETDTIRVKVDEKKQKEYDSESEGDADEDDWEQDEELEDESDTGYGYEHENHKKRVTEFSAPPAPQHRPPPNTLVLPVIIPQRRPGTRNRGFVRAYAPDLARCGIYEEDFLRFHKELFTSMQSSKTITVINLAAFAVGFVPSVTALVLSTVVQTAAGFAAAIQGRVQCSKFMQHANQAYFNPRGLHAVIMTYKPEDSSQRFLSAELSQAFENSLLPKKWVEKKKATTATELPDSCPLIYPTAPENHNQASESGLKSTGSNIKSAYKFVQGYSDRRAQQKYIDEHQDSGLAGPAPQFLSQRGRPDSGKGSTIIGTALRGITGSTTRTRREQRRMRRAERRRASGRTEKEDLPSFV